MNIFDTHDHYDDDAFNDDRYELLDILPQNGIKYVINQRVNLETSRFSIELTKKYSYIYAAVGIHPENITENGHNIMILMRLKK